MRILAAAMLGVLAFAANAAEMKIGFVNTSEFRD